MFDRLKSEISRVIQNGVKCQGKERLLLVIRVADDGEFPAHVVKEIHRSKPWASYWLQRYSKEGIKGLRNKPKSWKNTTDSFRNIRKNKKDVKRKQTGMDYQTSK